MKLAETNLCSGCWACASVCPGHCIHMEPDAEGFLRPEIDETACIHCDRCRNVCPILNSPVLNEHQTKTYGAYCTDEDVRLQSTSGGIFTLLCKWVFQRGGVVFGAAYDGDFSVKHLRVDKESELGMLRGAKYAQSCLDDIFPQIKNLLEEARYVLFSGTPCQIGGLQAYLGKNWERLLLVDVVCHGVPSPAVWEYYTQYRSKIDAEAARPVAINLRSKESGWPEYSIRFDYENGSHYAAKNSADPFLRAFVGDLCLRPSCYSCMFKGLSRGSDFTLGDYWGVWTQEPALHDGKGTSLVLTHTKKAEAIWAQIQTGLCCKQVAPDVAVLGNPSAVLSSPKPEERPRFMENYEKEDFSELVDALRPIPEPPPKESVFRRILRRVYRLFQ